MEARPQKMYMCKTCREKMASGCSENKEVRDREKVDDVASRCNENKEERGQEKVDDELEFLNSSVSNQNSRSPMTLEFKRRVLDVLKNPYDEDEFWGHLEALKAGAYLNYYPDFGEALKDSCWWCKKGEMLNILRGFFFWLQNVPVDGAFKPWEDKECLAAMPGSS